MDSKAGERPSSGAATSKVPRAFEPARGLVQSILAVAGDDRTPRDEFTRRRATGARPSPGAAIPEAPSATPFSWPPLHMDDVAPADGGTPREAMPRSWHDSFGEARQKPLVANGAARALSLLLHDPLANRLGGLGLARREGIVLRALAIAIGRG
jgi:hypothetical protein